MIIVGIEPGGSHVAGNDRDVIWAFLGGNACFLEFLRGTTDAIALFVAQSR